ncbi:glycoside hydrolase family 6 protein [Frankia sp. Mgl5]|uniref:glycoside hydrolase family 6 protein n=1 Tax=Frankia sp. Mgl5 TaxID=2933793 RepID=UPI00200C70D9|nr:glycoside hydrolase family 6 protein [Frankia sp. Mgl5]MCK9930999.1 glycoside hydrolase family 6 protein [Frankia sp. Mgl5]
MTVRAEDGNGPKPRWRELRDRPGRPGRARLRRRACAAGATAAAVLALAACGGGSNPTPVTPSVAVATPDVPTGPLTAVGPNCPAGDPAGAQRPAESASSPDPAPAAPFLLDRNSQAAEEANRDPARAQTIAPLVNTPTAFPVGDWLRDVSGEVRTRVSASRDTGTTAIFMIYAIPHRDAGAGHSAGGLPNADAYRTFTRQVAGAISDARAVVVLEPDSLGQMDSLPADQQAERYALLNDAVGVYGALPNTSVYLDGANCGWTAAPVIADRLLRAGIKGARGFAVNVSNYYRTEDETARGEVVSALTGGTHFVVDTSRNGQGPADGIQDPWCNPPGRGLGIAPTIETGSPHADAFLWIKTPGASDGECGRGDPEAGAWWQQQAEELVRLAA